MENWLLHEISPHINFKFYSLEVTGKRVVMLSIKASFQHPTRIQKEEYIRIGSITKPLRDFQEIEQKLWDVLKQMPFEFGVALDNVCDEFNYTETKTLSNKSQLVRKKTFDEYRSYNNNVLLKNNQISLKNGTSSIWVLFFLQID